MADRVRHGRDAVPFRGRDPFEEFFPGSPVNPKASLIIGVVCGVRVETIEDPLVERIRWLVNLVDELAKGEWLAEVQCS